MSRIFLLRHAKAASALPGQRDFDRPLDSHGRDTARTLGITLMANGLQPDLIICSPAKRTRETLATVAEYFAFEVQTHFDAALFTDEWPSYMSALQTAGDAKNVMIIGHNPAIEETALQLANNGNRDALKALYSGFAPCSLAIFSVETPLSKLKPRQAFLENFLIDGIMTAH
jgi:phosphohistidine phosphatase